MEPTDELTLTIMNTINQQLANRLLYLPLDLDEKVFLWLTYKGLKPVSEICAEKRNHLNIRKMMMYKKYREKYKSTYSFTSPKSKRIRKWIKDAGIIVMPEKQGCMSWHIGKDIEKVKLSIKILRKFDYENELKTGLLFGFPEASVKAYAKVRNETDDQIRAQMIWPGNNYNHPYLKGKYFTHYILYAIRRDRVELDCLVAKKWADTIRHDVPKLATWFEAKEKRRTVKESRASS